MASTFDPMYRGILGMLTSDRSKVLRQKLTRGIFCHFVSSEALILHKWSISLRTSECYKQNCVD